MKKIVLALGAFAALSLTSCSDNKAKVKKDFVKSCIDGAVKQAPSEDMKKYLQDYCECSGEKVVEKFSVKELEDMNKLQTAPDMAKQQEMQAKMMPVIQPCLTELQQKMMKTMGGGMQPGK